MYIEPHKLRQCVRVFVQDQTKFSELKDDSLLAMKIGSHQL